ncbi:MAG: CheR family methyltransferase, partial [Planctomycetota bacterium]
CIAWQHLPCAGAGDVTLQILATDVDEVMLDRARRGCYGPSSLTDVPDEWLADSFTAQDGEQCVRAECRRGVEFRLQDIRAGQPTGPFDLILCRNLVFTYFDEALQQSVGRALVARLREDGLLVAGKQEAIPAAALGLVEWSPRTGIYRRATDVLTVSRACGCPAARTG